MQDKDVLNSILGDIKSFSELYPIVRLHSELMQAYSLAFTRDESLAITTQIICDMVGRSINKPPEENVDVYEQ